MYSFKPIVWKKSFNPWLHTIFAHRLQKVFLLLVKQLRQKTRIFFFVDNGTFSPASSLGYWKARFFGKYIHPCWIWSNHLLKTWFVKFFFHSIQKDKVVYPEMAQLHGTYALTGIWNSWAAWKVLRQSESSPCNAIAI